MKDRIRQAVKLSKQKETPFKAVNLDDAVFIPTGMTRALRNNRYTVMIYDNTKTTKGTATKVLIQNHFDSPIHRHWAEIQRIKNEIFGKETTAIEFYPSEETLIDDFNIYWIWIFPNNDLPIPI